LNFIAGLCKKLGVRALARKVASANTAREAFFILKEARAGKVFKALCRMVRDNARTFAGPRIRVVSMLIGYDDEIVLTC
ncbi:MAG: hypothetical protein HZB21_07190, partial [Deltaproteobacteria bacterium]|nr:hypothetical protein [Deltaproteobacteria bacterium]